MHILLSNDDGIQAEGLEFLRRELGACMPEARITTVAPDREQSAKSHALTLADPLRVEEFGERRYSVSGTPTDCVLIATKALLADDPPDVVISGINHGPNMGEDVHYSGTVAAAFEGMVMGIPGIAISLASKVKPRNFDAAGHFIRNSLRVWLGDGLPSHSLLNVNIPARNVEDIAGLKLCKLGSREYQDQIVRKEDPRGRAYYWIGGDAVTYVQDTESDFVISEQGFITVTPLHVDITDYKALVTRKQLEETWPH